MQSSIWENAIEVFFERGLSIRRIAKDTWQFCANCSIKVLTPDEIPCKYTLRPVYAIFQQNESGSTYSMVFPAFGGRFLNIRLSELQQVVYKRKSASWFLDTQSLFFLLGATNYHCERLASIYASAVKYFADRPFLHSDTDRVVTQTYEVFYEFDSMVTVVIRALDSARYLMWRVFNGSGTIPSSFMRTVRSLSSMPTELRLQLKSSWENDFSYAKEYRDCIQHYLAVGSRAWCMHYKLEKDLWAMWARIPDNPESRSAKAFVFKKELDALTYAWELATRLFSIVELLLENAIAISNNDTCKNDRTSETNI